MHSEGQFSEASQVTGKAFAADYGGVTATKLTTAVSDMQTAYTDAAARESTLNLGGENGSMTLSTGVYSFDGDITIGMDITFSGDENSVFIMKTAGNLMQAKGTKVLLDDGAQAKNIFWQVAGQVQVSAGAQLEGVVLVKNDALFMTGSSLNGRVLAQTACDLQSAVITQA